MSLTIILKWCIFATLLISRRTFSQLFAGQVWPQSHISSSDLHDCTGNSWRRGIWSLLSHSVSVFLLVCVIILPSVKLILFLMNDWYSLLHMSVCVCVFFYRPCGQQPDSPHACPPDHLQEADWQQAGLSSLWTTLGKYWLSGYKTCTFFYCKYTGSCLDVQIIFTLVVHCCSFFHNVDCNCSEMLIFIRKSLCNKCFFTASVCFTR